MATVDQLLRQLARRLDSVPYWVLEKDYALSYLLAGIVATPALHDSLILKGGTALRKGYFDDHRFSEDLDFSLRPDQSLPNGTVCCVPSCHSVQPRSKFSMTCRPWCSAYGQDRTRQHRELNDLKSQVALGKDSSRQFKRSSGFHLP